MCMCAWHLMTSAERICSPTSSSCSRGRFFMQDSSHGLLWCLLDGWLVHSSFSCQLTTDVGHTNELQIPIVRASESTLWGVRRSTGRTSRLHSCSWCVAIVKSTSMSFVCPWPITWLSLSFNFSVGPSPVDLGIVALPANQIWWQVVQLKIFRTFGGVKKKERIFQMRGGRHGRRNCMS